MNDKKYLKVQKSLTNLFLILEILLIIFAVIFKAYLGALIVVVLTIPTYIYLRNYDKKEVSRLSDNYHKNQEKKSIKV